MKVGLLTVLTIGLAIPTHEAAAQMVRVAVDCQGERLTGAQRETCASPDLTRRTNEVDQLTLRLEKTLTGRNKQALLDTEGPFMVQRNDCQNARPAVHECVERVLKQRIDALTAASTSASTILNELSQYTFLSIEYFLKWGDLIVGRRVHVYGCMVLDPGRKAESRLTGTITGYGCSKKKGPTVSAAFRSMNENRAEWFDEKLPSTHWEGVVERRNGRLVLAQIEP